ncbi:chlorophyll synthase ChlG [Lichenicola sp.]|uniref:chlorophyll synthase ChlG n=1 Tax=Lichenicola sp. TaxID=2804529 RepID=UPI003AFFEE36
MSDQHLATPTGDLRRPTLPDPVSVLTLLKPITWFAPMWAFGCGIVSSGMTLQPRWPVIVAGVVLAGPMMCGTSQAVNDWFDRHVDAINEPGRPIPSGRIPGQWGLLIAIAWTVLSVVLAVTLGPWVSVAAAAGMVLAWAYSAPPVRLKRDGWIGNLAVGISYEGLPWFAGAALMLGAFPQPHVIVAALIYSLGAHGIMTLNDFKSIEGDRRTGVASLPARLGEANACRIACLVMTLSQLAMSALLGVWGLPIYGAAVAGLLLVQLLLMLRLLEAPRLRAPWYNGTGTTLYVIGMLVTAFAIRP